MPLSGGGGGGGITSTQWKEPVRCATTANVNLTTGVDDGSSIDGVTIATGDRVLLKDQTLGENNGIYIVQASGAPVRATDFDTGAKAAGAMVFVREGTANGDKAFAVATNGTIVLGTTALTFAQFGTSSTLLADDTTTYSDDGIRFAGTTTSFLGRLGGTTGHDAIITLDEDLIDLVAEDGAGAEVELLLDPDTPVAFIGVDDGAGNAVGTDWDAQNEVVNIYSSGHILLDAATQVRIDAIPTSDPAIVGALYRDGSGNVKISM